MTRGERLTPKAEAVGALSPIAGDPQRRYVDAAGQIFSRRAGLDAARAAATGNPAATYQGKYEQAARDAGYRNYKHFTTSRASERYQTDAAKVARMFGADRKEMMRLDSRFAREWIRAGQWRDWKAEYERQKAAGQIGWSADDAEAADD